MKLTTERTEMLGKYLQEDVERAKMLVELAPEEAVKKINADGFNFTVDEIVEFGENLRIASSDELTEDNLSEVAGGVIGVAAAGIYLTCVSIGVTLGIAAGDHKRW